MCIRSLCDSNERWGFESRLKTGNKVPWGRFLKHSNHERIIQQSVSYKKIKKTNSLIGKKRVRAVKEEIQVEWQVAIIISWKYIPTSIGKQRNAPLSFSLILNTKWEKTFFISTKCWQGCGIESFYIAILGV